MAAKLESTPERPEQIAARRGYGWTGVRHDAIAGLTVAAIATPQAMAYALIAGVEPRYGLYAAIVVTAVGSVFGSSSFLINGPTNAISLVVFSALAFLSSSVHPDPTKVAEAMFLLAVMVGAIQIAIALFKLGDLTRYISESVVLGFMAGAGVLIAISQVGNLFGLVDQGNGHQHILYRLSQTIDHGGAINPRALGIGLGVTISVVVLRRIVRKFHLPRLDMLLVLIVAAALTDWLGWSVVDGNGKRLVAVVGNVPGGLPGFHLPAFNLDWMKEMGGSAVAIAVLGLLEALAIAKSLATQTRQSLDYNRQCLAEGLANLSGGLFQCMPGSGSLTRSAINFQAGAVSRLSGVFSAAATAVIMLLFTPLAGYVPKAALAGILMVTAYGLVDWPRLRYALRTSRYDAVLVLATALTAVFWSVEFSILIGTMLSFIMYIPRASRLKGTELAVGTDRVVRELLPDERPCTGLVVFDLEGELFFGASPELEAIFDELHDRAAAGARVIVLRLRRTRNPDMVCMKLFEQFLHDMHGRGVKVLLCGVREDFSQAMINLRFYELLPADRIFYQDAASPGSSTIDAVRHGYELLGDHTCPACALRNKIEPNSDALYYMI
ncbi:MAG TPA: SulP family inorganic anion transporter [Pirellulales bacterium]|jgi:SulP family sulfate permease|nr:SulP family inorganic anion transporter [Pirellulales bacterium]